MAWYNDDPRILISPQQPGYFTANSVAPGQGHRQDVIISSHGWLYEALANEAQRRETSLLNGSGHSRDHGLHEDSISSK